MRAVTVSRAVGYGRLMTILTRGALLTLVLVSQSMVAGAQGTRDTTVAPPVRPRVAPQRSVTRLTPPLSPRRAFLYSFVLPGFGQSRLDRGTSGALFASVELSAIAMVIRSRSDLSEVRRYRVDTLAGDFTVNGDALQKTGDFTNRYSSDLEKTRQLHVEDWIAVVAFNHLFAGADAFVAAQLWDVPVSLTAMPLPGGVTLVASVRW